MEKSLNGHSDGLDLSYEQRKAASHFKRQDNYNDNEYLYSCMQLTSAFVGKTKQKGPG